MNTKKYTKEAILTASAFSKYVATHGGTYPGVLSKKKLEEMIRDFNVRVTSITVITCSGMDLDIPNDDKRYYFFTTDHCFGVTVLPKCFVPVTSQFPMSVRPRTGLEDGVIDSLDKFIQVFHNDEERLDSIEELVDFLNQNFV